MSTLNAHQTYQKMHFYILHKCIRLFLFVLTLCCRFAQKNLTKYIYTIFYFRTLTRAIS